MRKRGSKRTGRSAWLVGANIWYWGGIAGGKPGGLLTLTGPGATDMIVLFGEDPQAVVNTEFSAANLFPVTEVKSVSVHGALDITPFVGPAFPGGTFRYVYGIFKAKWDNATGTWETRSPLTPKDAMREGWMALNGGQCTVVPNSTQIGLGTDTATTIPGTMPQQHRIRTRPVSIGPGEALILVAQCSPQNPVVAATGIAVGCSVRLRIAEVD